MIYFQSLYTHLQSHLCNHSLGNPPHSQAFIWLHRSTARELQAWHGSLLAWSLAVDSPDLNSSQAPRIHMQRMYSFSWPWQLKPMAMLMWLTIQPDKYRIQKPEFGVSHSTTQPTMTHHVHEALEALTVQKAQLISKHAVNQSSLISVLCCPFLS